MFFRKCVGILIEIILANDDVDKQSYEKNSKILFLIQWFLFQAESVLK